MTRAIRIRAVAIIVMLVGLVALGSEAIATGNRGVGVLLEFIPPVVALVAISVTLLQEVKAQREGQLTRSAGMWSTSVRRRLVGLSGARVIGLSMLAGVVLVSICKVGGLDLLPSTIIGVMASIVALALQLARR